MGDIKPETKVLIITFNNGIGEDKRRYLTDDITEGYIYYTDSFLGDKKRLNLSENRIETLMRNGEWKSSNDNISEYYITA